MSTSSSAEKPLNMLISLHQGYGIGDAVQMSAVLRHVRRYRPHWIVEFRAEEGRECVGRGIAHHIRSYGQPRPHPCYDAEVQICLYDTWANWHDRPNTRVTSCLHECFDIQWDASLARYEINVRDEVMNIVDVLVPRRAVALHYKGDSSPTRKDLNHGQAKWICKEIRKLDHNPLIIDWRNVSPLRFERYVYTTGGNHCSKQWGKDVEYNTAVIKLCKAFIGIDSGPAKCAGATDTPALVVWTGHHPAQFYDPAPNVTHLVPSNYNGLFPVCNNRGVIEWFESHHVVRTYSHNTLLPQIGSWLEEILR